MPTVLRVGPYRFFFYSGDREEPRHIHVERDADRAKFCLEPVRLHGSTGFRGAELARLAAIVEAHQLQLVRAWVSSSAADLRDLPRAPLAAGARVTDDALVVDLDDGRTVSVPLAWYPRLLHGTPAERAEWRLIGRGDGLHWPALDEDISVAALLAGRPSAESPRSLEQWLAGRNRKGAA